MCTEGRGGSTARWYQGAIRRDDVKICVARDEKTITIYQVIYMIIYMCDVYGWMCECGYQNGRGASGRAVRRDDVTKRKTVGGPAVSVSGPT